MNAMTPAIIAQYRLVLDRAINRLYALEGYAHKNAQNHMDIAAHASRSHTNAGFMGPKTTPADPELEAEFKQRADEATARAILYREDARALEALKLELGA